MWLLLRTVVETYFRRAPHALGGWEGADSADICAQISTMSAAQWMTDSGANECEARIARRVDGWALALAYIASLALIVGCVRRLPQGAAAVAQLGSWLVALCCRRAFAGRSTKPPSPPIETPPSLLSSPTTPAHPSNAAAFALDHRPQQQFVLKQLRRPAASPADLFSSPPRLTDERVGRLGTVLTVAAAPSARTTPVTRAQKALATRQLNERNRALASLLVRLVRSMRTIDQRTPVGDVLRAHAAELAALPESIFCGGDDENDE